MNDLSLRYVQRQKLTGLHLMLRKTQNDSGDTLPGRTMTVLIQKYVRDFLKTPQSSRRWVVIPGLRGVGKTTITAQTYLSIHRQLGQKVNLIYISLDEVVEKLNSNLAETLEAYESILEMRLEALDRPTFIFIDEVQADVDWARTLKFIYDRTNKVFFLCTGSSATHLQMDADVDGRRAQIEKLYPLSYPEYQVLSKGIFPKTGLKNELIETLYRSANAVEAHKKLKVLESTVNQQWAKYDRRTIDTYITTGSIPFTLHNTERNVYMALKAMIDKVIVSDLQNLKHFNTDSITAMKRLLFILADSNDIVTLSKLANWIGSSQPQLLNMLDALIKAELLIKVPACGNNATATRNPSKYYFMSPALRAAHYDIVGDPGTEATRKGMLMEDAAALHFYREFATKNRGSIAYFYDKNGGQCDFVFKIGNTHQLAIEIGLGQKGVAQAEQTMGKVNCQYGIVFSESKLRINADKSVITVPLDFFFLM